MDNNTRPDDIECEIRGCITRSDFNEIRIDIEKDWGKLDESPELVIFFKGENDLRLKINKNGGALVLKKTIDQESGSRRETELLFKPEDMREVVNFINQLGFKNGLFSYCHRFNASNGNKSISIKFDTKIGDLFEVDEVVNNKTNFINVRNNLIKIVARYGLNAWSNETYKKIIDDSWSGVKTETLLQKDKLHPLIIKAIGNFPMINAEKHIYGPSIASVMENKTNNYSELEKTFKKKTGNDLLSWGYSGLENYQEKISIVIPTYNSWESLKLTLESLKKQKLHKNQKKLIEIIVVDDGSKDKTEKNIKNVKLKLRYVKQNHLGRVYARNLGASIAQGKILIFLDSDVILEKHFLNEHIKRHHCLDNIVLLGFKENIESRSFIINKKKSSPDIKKDFRFEKIVKKDWMRTHRHVRNIELRKTKIMEETDNLKNFGEGRVVGVWDLPSMVVSSAISMKKESFTQIGGFNLQFQGWGMEDTFLGACLIANNNYIIPCFSTGIFHIKHELRSGTHRKQIIEFNRNVLVYLDLIYKPIYSVFKKYL